MRRLLVLTFLFIAPLGCVKTDPAPVYVSVGYQVRCIDCEPRSVDDDPHDVAALDGEKGMNVSCTVEQRGSDRLVTWSATYTDPKRPSAAYGIKVLQADIDKKDPGSSCRVSITEGSNTYLGRCGSGDPTADQPCQLKMTDVSGVAKGKIVCGAVPNRNDSMITRHVVAPGTTDPASFEIDGCAGL